MCQNGNGHNTNGNGKDSNGNGERPRLTGLQRAFIDAYLGDARYNATEAAAIAGYGGNRRTLASIASENLTKPNIMAEIARRQAGHGVTEEEITGHLAQWMRFDASVLLRPHGGLDWEQVRKHGRYIKKVTEYKNGSRAVEVHDQMKAAELLARTVGMFRDRVEQEHTGEVVVRFAKPAEFPE